MTAASGEGLRFLIDNALSPRFATQLGQEGFDAIHVHHIAMAGASDIKVLQRAERDGRVVVSEDTDFGMLLAHTRAAPFGHLVPDIVQVARPPALARAYAPRGRDA